MKTIKCKYSGKESIEFWDRVNALKDSDQQELYSLGVALQNLEGQVLNQLENAEHNS